MPISHNASKVKQIIVQTCQQVNRMDYPQVVVVTKRQELEDISQLYDCGYRHFAENRVSDLLLRQSQFPQKDIVWHLIGTLQTRKVKEIINKVDYFHALDRLSLAEEINKRATKVIKCFVQINCFNESNKHGFTYSELDFFWEKLSAFKQIEVVGLMAMAPFEEKEAYILTKFQELAAYQQVIKNKQIENAPCHFLSIGMSQDYPIAIRAGATHLRIGSAFFE